MRKLGMWTSRAIRNARRLEIGRHKIAAVIGVSGAAVLIAMVVEAVATAVFYASLAVAAAYVVIGFVGPKTGEKA